MVSITKGMLAMPSEIELAMGWPGWDELRENVLMLGNLFGSDPPMPRAPYPSDPIFFIH